MTNDQLIERVLETGIQNALYTKMLVDLLKSMSREELEDRLDYAKNLESKND